MGFCEGTRPLSFWQFPISQSDRPLVISTWRQARKIFSDITMQDPEFAVGFLDYSAIAPEFFNLASATPAERASYVATKNFLETLAASGEKLATNGRAVFLAHGESNGNISIEYGHPLDQVPAATANPEITAAKHVQLSTAENVGYILADLSNRYNIDISQLDLQVCCEGTAAVSDGVLNGFEAFGKQKKFLPNIEVRGFTVVTNSAIKKQFTGGTYIGDAIAGLYKPTDWFFIIYDKLGKRYLLPMSDFYVKGKLPDVPAAQESLMVLERLGIPKKVHPPVVRDWKPSGMNAPCL